MINKRSTNFFNIVGGPKPLRRKNGTIVDKTILNPYLCGFNHWFETAFFC